MSVVHRFAPPPHAPRFLARSHLVSRAKKGGNCVFLAPAGYGKTSLMAETHNTLRAEGRCVVWLSAGPETSDPTTFLRYLEQAFPEAAAPEEGGRDWPERLGHFLGALADRPEGAGIFLDGIEDIAGAGRDVIRDMLAFAHPGVTVCVAGRSGAQLDLAKLELSGRVTLFRRDSLRFSATELSAFAADCFADMDVRALELQTDGWPAAIGLLINRYLRRTGQDEALRLPDALRLDLARYCEEQIFSRLPEGLCRFVCETALFDEFSIRFAQQVCEVPDAAPLVDDLYAADLFVRAASDDGATHCYDPVFAAIAAGRVERRLPDRARTLHRRAAEWFGENGNPAQAIYHASLCENPDFQLEMTEHVGGLRAGFQKGPLVLDHEPDMLSESGLMFPQTMLGHIYSLAYAGRVAEAREQFEKLRGQTENFSRFEKGAGPSGVTYYARTLDLTLRLYEDRPVRQRDIAALEDLVARTATQDLFVAGGASSLLGLSHINLNRFADAIQACRSALDRVGDKADLVRYFVELKLGASLMATGRLDRAGRHFDNAIALGTDLYGSESANTAAARILRAGLYYEMDEIATAGDLFRSTFGVLVPGNGWFELYAEGFSAAAALAAITGGRGAWEKVLEDCRSVARQRSLVRLEWFADILEVRELVRSGAPAEALEKLEQPRMAALLRPGRPATPWRERLTRVARIEAARTFASLGRYQDALDQMAQMSASGLKHCDVRLQLTYHVLVMISAFRLRRYNEAIASLASAVLTGHRSGLKRRLQNHVHEILEVFEWAQTHGRVEQPELTAIVGDLKSTLSRTRLKPPRQFKARTAPDVFLLSPRERSVLEFIAAGLSTKEIAHRLSISDGTVKTHRKNIYRKLGVSSRSKAISVARNSVFL